MALGWAVEVQKRRAGADGDLAAKWKRKEMAIMREESFF
jgi:hypothetical protein